MTALACVAKDFGMKVTGSDTSEIFLTDSILQKKNIQCYPGFSKSIISQLNPEWVIYTAAHKGENNPQVQEAKRLGIAVSSQGEALGLFQKTKLGISVAGVGGKTTTAALLATIFEKAKKNPGYMIGVGGVSSLEYPGKYDSRGEVFITEADEYACSPDNPKPKFYYQKPKVIIIPNLAFDHPDVYKDEAATLQVFADFVSTLPKDGVLIANIDCSFTRILLDKTSVPVWTYGESEESQWKICNYTNSEGATRFALEARDGTKTEYTVPVPGRFNTKNAVGAILAAKFFKIDDNHIMKGLISFRGVKRRFELIAKINSTLFYDDYAHHPDEIKATLQTARECFPGKRIIVIFQPHTYSRTKVLLKQFAASFSDADEVILIDIFASAREQDNPAINSKVLAKKITHPKATYLLGKEAVLNYIASQNLENTLLFTMGAGDIYTWSQEIISILKKYE